MCKKTNIKLFSQIFGPVKIETSGSTSLLASLFHVMHHIRTHGFLSHLFSLLGTKTYTLSVTSQLNRILEQGSQ